MARESSGLWKEEGVRLIYTFPSAISPPVLSTHSLQPVASLTMSNEDGSQLYIEYISDDEEDDYRDHVPVADLEPLVIEAPVVPLNTLDSGGEVSESDEDVGVDLGKDDEDDDEVEIDDPATWPTIDPSQYEIPQCEYIIDKDTTNQYDFQYLRICIHRILRHIICLGCGRVVHPNALAQHLTLKHCYKDVAVGIGAYLAHTYQLETEEGRLNYVPYVLPPIVGIPLEPTALLFCGICRHGYKSKNSLKVHGSTGRANHGKHFMKKRFLAYGQKIRGCSRTIYIPVDIATLSCNPDLPERRVNKLAKTAHGEQNYSTMAITLPTEDLSMTSFFRSQNWTRQLEGFTPDNLLEARRMYTDEDPVFVIRLRNLAKAYFGKIDSDIIDDLQFGLGTKLGSVRPDSSDTPMFIFGKISPPSQDKYGLDITKLLFMCIRFYVCPGTWNTPFQLPQIPDKVKAGLVNLYHGLINAGALEDPILSKPKQLWTAEEREIVSRPARATARKALLELYHSCLLLLFTHTRAPGGSAFFSPVISYYIIHMYGDDGRLRAINGLTNVAAHIMYILRGCIGIQAQQDARTLKVSVTDTIKNYERYLKDMEESVLSFFYNSLRYLVPLRRLEGNKSPFILADSSMDKMIYQGVVFHRTDMKTMIEAQLARYDAFLKKAIMYGETMGEGVVFPVVDFSSLFDDLANRGRGYAFITDPGNGLLHYRTTYYHWLMADPIRRNHWMTPSGEIRREAAMAWLKVLQPIEVMLAVGLLISAGPSPRNTEFVRQLYRQEGDSNRSFMVLFQCLSLTSVTDKNSHQHKQDKFVPHVPSRSWAVRAVQHMSTLRPFTEFLVEVLFPSDADIQHRYHFQMWPTLTGVMTDRAFGNEMARITYEHLGVSFRVKQWRQLTTLFAHRIQELVAFKYPDDLIADTLNMHSTRTSNWKYGGSASLGPGSDARRLVRLVEGSLAWHKLINIDQENPLRCDTPPGVKISHPSPAAHSSRTDLGPMLDHITRLENTLQAYKNSLGGLINQSVASAFVLHRISSSGPLSRSAAPASPAPTPTIFIQPALLQAFRHFLNDKKATFRTSGQGQLIALGYENKSNVLAVIPTSSGKTAATLFLSSISSLVTLIFVPLVALCDNVLDDAKRYGIRAAKFDGDDTNTSVHLLVLALEHLDDKIFTLVKKLSNENRIKRVVFDEIHLYFTQGSYRDHFQKLYQLPKLKAPIIYLSASVPPSRLAELQRAARVPWATIREPSNRAEIAYNLIQVKDEVEQVAAAIAYVRERVKDYGEKDRALVFCRNKNLCMKVADELQVPAYFASLDISERREILDSWFRGDTRVVVNTPCLGTGFHYSSIRDVVHIAGAYSMIDQYQEDSRGGRDGRRANAAIFFSLPLPVSSNYYSPDPILHSWLERSGSECARIIPSLYLDGEAVTCTTLPQAELCSYCTSRLLLKLSDEVTVLPSRPITPPPNLKRALELTPEGITLSDKHMKDTPASPEVFIDTPPSPPVTLHRPDLQPAFNRAEIEAPVVHFRNEIDGPLQQIITTFHKHCVVCALLAVEDRSLNAGRHKTSDCPSAFYRTLQSQDIHGIQFTQFVKDVKFVYHDACTRCGLPIHPAGTHPAPLESECTEQDNIIKQMLYIYFAIGCNRRTQWVPDSSISVPLSFAMWCKSRRQDLSEEFGHFAVYNYWVLVIQIWDAVVNKSI